VKLVVALVALGGCRDAFDPAKPIDVVALGAWSDAQRADLDHAAECWNLGFGLDYQTASTSDGQRVEVEFNDVECLYSAWALTTDGFTSQVSLCPAHFPPSPYGALFGVLTHELGHVAGIPADVDDPDAIMGGSEPIGIASRLGDPIFSPTDHALFASYNADFTVKPTCPPTIQQIDGAYRCSCDGRFAGAVANAAAFDSQGNLYVAGLVESTMTLAGNELVPIGADDVLVASFDATGSYRWAQRFGAPAQSAHATAIAIDGADNVYVAGIASGAIDFGGAAIGTGGTTFTASFDSTGAYRWSRADPSDLQATPSLAVAGGVVFVETGLFGKATYSPSVTIDTGVGSAAVMLASDSTTGALRWVRDYITDETLACGVVAAANWIVFAACNDTPHGWTTRLVSMTTAGATRWSVAGPDTPDPGLALDAAGNLYVAGWADDSAVEISEPFEMFVASYDVRGVARWSSAVVGGTNVVRSPPIHVAVDAGGTVVVDGRVGDGVESNDDDELVAAFASDGTALVSQIIAGTGGTTTQAIAFDRDGILELAGGYTHDSNIGAVDFGNSPVIENGGLFVLSVP